MKRPLVLHPFLLAAFPVLSLYARNANELRPDALLIPLIAVLGFVVVTYFPLSTWVLPGTKAGIVVSVFLVLWFSYGHVVEGLDRLFRARNIFDWGDLEVPLFVYLVWSLLFVKTLFWIRKPEKEFHKLTRFMNVLGCCLFCVPRIQIALFGLRSRPTLREDAFRAPTTNLQSQQMSPSKPDIYYFILDGYARADVLRRIFDYDNQPFLDDLTRRGFFVAAASRSNYSQTTLSLASSFNLDYLQNLPVKFDSESDSRSPLQELILSNRLLAILRERGYGTISFPSGYPLTDLITADSFLSEGYGVDEFQSVLIGTTPVPQILQGLDIGPLHGLRFFDPYESHRRRLLFPFERIPELAKRPGPKFIFIHTLAPHPPFVFDANGEPTTPKRPFSFATGDMFLQLKGASESEYIEGYRRQLEFINRVLVRTLDQILAVSPHPPVIILQADHGSDTHLKYESLEGTDLSERLSIFNAYYFPGGKDVLYEGITPVNTFRVALNRYFGTNFDLLPDRSYFSTWSYPYKFIDVTSRTVPTVVETASTSSQVRK